MQRRTELAKTIQCFITDLDGILTDGRIYYSEKGEYMKAFHVQDGLGLKLLMQSGIEIAVITAGCNAIIDQRMQALNITHVYQGCFDKMEAYDTLKHILNLKDSAIAYMGDDWPDLPLIQRAGLGITASNGIDPVRAAADWVTTCTGGNGAIREVCDFILNAQGKYSDVIAPYLV